MAADLELDLHGILKEEEERGVEGLRERQSQRIAEYVLANYVPFETAAQEVYQARREELRVVREHLGKMIAEDRHLLDMLVFLSIRAVRLAEEYKRETNENDTKGGDI